MVKYEKKEQVIIEETPVKVICDICGKEVNPNNWFRIDTHHFDWGNDSVDSCMFNEVCSDKCAMLFAKEYVKEAYETECNTKVIEISHMRSIANL